MNESTLAKVNETLKAGGRRLLSSEELESVNGGWCIQDLTPEEAAYFHYLMAGYAQETDPANLTVWIKKINDFDRKMTQKYGV